MTFQSRTLMTPTLKRQIVVTTAAKVTSAISNLMTIRTGHLQEGLALVVVLLLLLVVALAVLVCN